MSTSSTPEQWLQQVQHVQSERMTPQVRLRVKAQRERHQQMSIGSKSMSLQQRSRRVEKCSKMSKALWAGSMSNTFSPSPASSRHLSEAAPPAAAAAAAPSLGAAEMEMEVDQASLSRPMDSMASVQQIIRSGTSAHALAAQSEEDFEAQT